MRIISLGANLHNVLCCASAVEAPGVRHCGIILKCKRSIGGSTSPKALFTLFCNLSPPRAVGTPLNLGILCRHQERGAVVDHER